MDLKIYIQADSRGMPYNVNAFSAMDGFESMGFETVLFSKPEELADVPATDIVVGGVGRVKAFLSERGIMVDDIDYPTQLNDYYGRKIWSSTVGRLISGNHTAPIFVKPKEGKKFTGFVYRTQRDLIGRIAPDEDYSIYCSEVINICEEWRCFVRYGEILDIRRYDGAIGLAYDFSAVQSMVKSYSDAPGGYALDIGVTDKKRTVVIEVNDGYSLGSYGLDPLLYAKLLSARWAQLTHGIDECAF